MFLSGNASGGLVLGASAHDFPRFLPFLLVIKHVRTAYAVMMSVGRARDYDQSCPMWPLVVILGVTTDPTPSELLSRMLKHMPDMPSAGYNQVTQVVPEFETAGTVRCRISYGVLYLVAYGVGA